jgi:enoyl-CoA hydratase
LDSARWQNSSVPAKRNSASRCGLIWRPPCRKAPETRAAAEELAQQLADLPQACLRGDRRSALEQHALDLPAALQNELRHGVHTLSLEGFGGAQRFAAGAGRHGADAPQQ